MLLTSPLGSFILEALLSCPFVTAGGAERGAPNPAQLLRFAKELEIDGDSNVPHVLEPMDGFVYFLDDSAQSR